MPRFPAVCALAVALSLPRPTVAAQAPSTRAAHALDDFKSLRSLTTAPDGSLLFVAEDTLYRLTSDGTRSTVLALRKTPPRDFRFLPQDDGVAVDRAGNVYVAQTAEDIIVRIGPAGAKSIVAGRPHVAGLRDGAGRTALFRQPCGLAFDAQGRLLVADRGNHVIRRIDAQGRVTTIAGGRFGRVDGPRHRARFTAPYALAVMADGSLRVAESMGIEDDGFADEARAIRRVDTNGQVSTLAQDAFYATHRPNRGQPDFSMPDPSSEGAFVALPGGKGLVECEWWRDCVGGSYFSKAARRAADIPIYQVHSATFDARGTLVLLGNKRASESDSEPIINVIMRVSPDGDAQVLACGRVFYRYLSRAPVARRPVPVNNDC